MKKILNRRKFMTMLITAAASGAMPALLTNSKAFAVDAQVKDVVVIGGGISGLVSAYLLQKKDVLLLEAEQEFGGRTLSGNYNGWEYTKGTEYLGPPSGVFKELLEDLGVKPVEIPSPMDQIWSDGQFYNGHAGRIELLVHKGGLETFNRFLRALQNVYEQYDENDVFCRKNDLKRLDTITCQQWFDELKLPPVYSEMYNVTFRGLFGANINEVSALCAFSEIAFDFEGMSLPVTDNDVQKLAGNAKDAGSGAYTFKTGITEVTAALAKRLGDKALSSAEVTSVTGNDEDGYVVSYAHNGQQKQVIAKSVIFVTPLPVTIRIGSSVMSQRQIRLMGQTPYSQYVTIALFSDDPIYTGAFDLALPDRWFVTDVYDSTWVQRKLGDSHKGYVASLYIGPDSYKNNALITASDAELLEKSYADLERIWPDIKKKVKGYDIHRFEYAYPVQTLGAYARLAELYDVTKGGVQLAGDGMFYPTYEGAITAASIAVGRIKEWF